MKKQAKQRIVIIGCGNVAWHIAKHLVSLKKYEVFVYNHRKNPLLNSFKSVLKCHISVGSDQVIGNAEAYFICVKDKYISSVAAALKIRNPRALLMHTSGSMKLEELGESLHPSAVFYPLQSFSRSIEVDWSSTPIFVEGNSKESQKAVSALAALFSKKVLFLDYKQRLKFHLAAVFVNNFTNSLYVSASDLLKQGNKKLDFELLLPIIAQTTRKLDHMEPKAAQTGPAKRKDEGVMKKHLDLLSGHKDLKKLYKQLSQLIATQQKPAHA